MIALSVPLAYGSFMAWTGRWRSWTGELILGSLPVPITMMPALAVFFLGVGLGLVGAVGPAVPGIAVFVLIPGIVLFLWAPGWWGPGWYREADKPFESDDPSKLNLKDPLTALAYASSQPAPPRKPLPEPFRGRPLTSWKGNFVERDEPGMRNVMARKGKVEGRLNLYEAGVTFAAEGLATRMEEPPDPIVVEADHVLDVRVVPAGAGPDGKKRHNTGLRSLFKRLVIDTPDGPLLFEVQRATEVQRQISDAL
jgi:hypothetical protein